MAEAGDVELYVVPASPGAPPPADGIPFDGCTADEALDPEPRNPDDTAVIIYTSGTTGKPKGAELTHFQMFMAATVAADTFDYRDDDVSMAVLPLFHVFGLSSVMNTAVRSRRDARAGAPLRGRRGARRDRAAPGQRLLRGADDVRRAAARRPGRARPLLAADLRLRRRLDPRRGAARVRGRLPRRAGARGLRAVGDLRDGHVQPQRRRAPRAVDRQAAVGRRGAGGRRRGPPAADRARSTWARSACAATW